MKSGQTFKDKGSGNMPGKLRKMGIDIIGSAPWSTHFCQFYQTKQDLIEILVPYFKAGLEENEFCMWVTSEPLDQIEARKALQKSVPDLNQYLERGQIEFFPYSEWYLGEGSFNSKRVLNGWVKKLESALSRGYEGLRLTGNTFWLEKASWRSFADYEAAINGIIGQYNMLALCTYSLDKCNASEVIDVIRNHEFAIIKQDKRWEIIESAVVKQTKEDLRISEERFRSIYENSPIGIELYDANGELVTANKACLEIFGVSEVSQVKGFHLFKDPNINPGIIARLRKGEPVGYEAPFDFEKVKELGLYETDKSGLAYLDVLLTPLKQDERSANSGYMAQVQDVTKRKMAEDALAQEKSILQVIMENTGACLVYLDTDFNFLQTNSAYARTCNTTPENLIGKNHFELYPDKENEVIFKRVRDTGEPAEYHDKPFKFPDQPHRGVTYWDWTLTPVKDYFNKVQGLVFSLVETTERKRAEQREAKTKVELEDRVKERTAELEKLNAQLHLMLDQLPSVLWVTDTNLVTTLSLGAGLQAFNLKPNQLVGTTLYEYYKTDDPDFYPIMSHRRALEGEPAHYELHWEGKVLSCYVEPMRDMDDNIAGVIGIGFDITDKKQAEDGLRALSRRLVDVQEDERRNIARELHDEIGQSLTALNLILSQATRSATEEASTNLVEAQSIVTELIRQVREMSLKLRPSMLDDLGLLPTLIWHIEHYTAQTQIKVDFEQNGLQEKFSPEINTALYRIVQEALTNVARHSKAKEVLIRMWTNDNNIFLRIEDHGRGFTSSTLSSSGSTGISGMRERVLLLGGKLNIETAPGSGTCLTAEFPLQEKSNLV
jgi:PAS domain S-box-containing protein